MFRRGCSGSLARKPDFFAAAQYGGGCHAALNASFRTVLRHRANWVHRRSVQAAIKVKLGQPEAFRGGHQPRDLLGGHRGDEGAQSAQTNEDCKALHQNCPALPWMQELQLHVCHHQVRILCMQIILPFCCTLSGLCDCTNSVFFLMHQLSVHSGLNLAPVSRLRGTWEKLPSKYEKLFGDLQDLFDPSRNMAKYRNVLNNQNLQPPIIPLFPVIKKDLTFLHEGRV